MTDSATECFDYMMNTRETYELLGQAVVLLEKLAARQHDRPENILTQWHTWGVVKGGERKWYRVFCETLRLARSDYQKCFSAEMMDTGRPEWLDSVQVEDVMKLALSRRDAWSQS